MATPTNQEMLDKTNEAIQALLNAGAVQSYNIGGRNLQHYSLKELMDLRQVLQAALSSEKGNARTYVGFTRPM